MRQRESGDVVGADPLAAAEGTGQQLTDRVSDVPPAGTLVVLDGARATRLGCWHAPEAHRVGVLDASHQALGRQRLEMREGSSVARCRVEDVEVTQRAPVPVPRRRTRLGPVRLFAQPSILSVGGGSTSARAVLWERTALATPRLAGGGPSAEPCRGVTGSTSSQACLQCQAQPDGLTTWTACAFVRCRIVQELSEPPVAIEPTTYA